MDALIKHLFWVIAAAVILVALGAWYLTVPAIKEDSGRLRSSNSQNLSGLKKMASNPKEIKTAKHVRAAQEFAKHLSDQEQAVLAFWQGKGLQLNGAFETPPPQDLQTSIEFDTWQIGVRQNIQALAATKGLALPPSFLGDMLYEGQDARTTAERQDRIPRLAIIREIVQILGAVRVPVPVLQFEQDAGKAEEEKETFMGALELARLAIKSPQDREQEQRNALSVAYMNGGGKYPADEEKAKIPVQATRVELEFIAPVQAVARVVQELERSTRWFAMVQKIDTCRTTEAYPPRADSERLKRMEPGSEFNARYNSHYREAPCRALVVFDLIEFDGKAAEEMLKPTPKPSANSSRVKGKTAAKKK